MIGTRLGTYEIVEEVASALDFAHRKGVLHRDIKPSNILLDLDGNAYLTDFGLARRGTAGERGGGLTLPGAILGTPTYMAPEQAMGGGGMDFRADVYALGAVLYELLTGSPPFPGDSAIAVAVAHMNAPVPSAHQVVPQLPAAVDGVLGRALAKSPRDRFLSAADLSRAAEAVLGHLSTGPPVALTKAARQYVRARGGGGSEGHRTTPTPGAARGGTEGVRPRPGTSEQMGLVVALMATFSEWLEPMEADALRLVRGFFDLAEGPSLQIRGRPAPVASYRVLGEKPTHLRLPSPAFEGLATRTVGREREEAALREAFEAVAAGNGPRVVALLGEAGIGKSRLLADLLHHVDLRAEPAWFFLGRAQPEAARKPLALFSDLLSNRFGSAVEDPTVPWRERVRKGLGPFFPEAG